MLNHHKQMNTTTDPKDIEFLVWLVDHEFSRSIKKMQPMIDILHDLAEFHSLLVDQHIDQEKRLEMMEVCINRLDITKRSPLYSKLRKMLDWLFKNCNHF